MGEQTTQAPPSGDAAQRRFVERQDPSNAPPQRGLDVSLGVEVRENPDPRAPMGCCDYFYFLQDKQ